MLMAGLLCAKTGRAQGIHFSQYFNSPQLLSPANTALTPDADYRIGANYRNQWTSVPAPFRTMSAQGDLKALGNAAGTNWLGIGAAVFSDRAGTGDLSLLKVQIQTAYHLQIGEYNMLSVGIGAAFAQRSVNFAKLTFDAQWDGFRFNPAYSQQETYDFQKTSYLDLAAGINYAFFPSDDVYFKLGLAVDHINRPKESFYNFDNRLGMRPLANLDFLVRLNSNWIASVSAYYTRQKQASEFVFGGQVSSNLSPQQHKPNVLILGVYHRLGDAIIPLVGFEWNKLTASVSVDVTVSEMAKATRGNSALEFSLFFKGLYGGRGGGPGVYSCPRF